MLNVNRSNAIVVKSLLLYEVRRDISNLYLPEEELLFAFENTNNKNNRFLITNMRLIGLDVVDDNIKSFTFLPHSRLQFYAIEGNELNAHTSKGLLYLLYTNGYELVLSFSEDLDLEALQHVLAIKTV